MSDNIANCHVCRDARNENIKLLKTLANELDEVQKSLDIAEIVSTAASIVTGVGSVVCFALAAPTGGMSAIPGYIVGGFGACSLAISTGAVVFKYFSEKDLIKKVQNALDKDKRESCVVKKHYLNIQMARTCLGCVSAVHTGRGLNVLSLLLDIVILVKTSIKAKNGSTHEAATIMRGIIKQLEDERDQIVNGS